jgi:magnesium transporter
MVVDHEGVFKGMLSANQLLIKSGDCVVSEVMHTQSPVFHTSDSAEQAARDFERYELIIAPVVNMHGKLVGVLRVNSLMDLMEELSQRAFLAQAGLSKEENLFDPLLKSAKNRWPWIALNLVIVLIASRIIDQFTATISSMVALAALLPVTANIGGNSGNQVVALVIRGLALQQLDHKNLARLFVKETSVAMINGVVWGAVASIVTYSLYGSFHLAAIMLLAMILTMVLAGLVGVIIPFFLKQLKQDPALGSSVITTGVTDTLGFLIFLGLATMFIG